MNSFEKDLIERYSKRTPNNLYNSDYSRIADEERIKKIKLLVNEFLTFNDKSTVLEVGAGQGGNIRHLKELGFNNSTIFLNELLTERIEICKLHNPEIFIYEGNAFTINFDQKFDCIFQSTVFTSILKDSERIELADKMWDMLKPGGIILWYDFIYNNPANPNVKKVSIKEVKKLFPKAVKTKITKVTLAPPIGRRVGKLYNLFNVPFLRSHILGVFQKSKI